MPTPRSEAADALITRLLWREQIRALPGAVVAAARRLVRREPRWYLVINGRVVARLVSRVDYDELLAWIAHVHAETFHMGVGFGEEVHRAADTRKAPDPGDPGPS